MKYQQEKEILAQMQLLNDLVQSQDKKIQELQGRCKSINTWYLNKEYGI